MAEFQKVMRELKRFCAKHDCVNCPIGEGIRNDRESSCSPWVTNHPEEAEPIIMKWAAEHPIMTNRMKFREVFGINLDSIEVVCRDGEGKVSHHQDVSAWLDKEYKGKDGQDDH